jgi:hypothetical protein
VIPADTRPSRSFEGLRPAVRSHRRKRSTEAPALAADNLDEHALRAAGGAPVLDTTAPPAPRRPSRFRIRATSRSKSLTAPAEYNARHLTVSNRQQEQRDVNPNWIAETKPGLLPHPAST